MKSASKKLAMLVMLLLLAGCVVGDALTTLTIQPDGSAELVIVRSNLHSTEQGEKAVKEIADFQSEFDGRSNDESRRVRDAGGSVVTAAWIRRETPLANLFHARFPSAAALERYWSIRSDDGQSQVTARFHSNGAHRRLTFLVTAPQDAGAAPPAATVDVREVQRSQANGISSTRIAVAGGRITGARGFTIADDKQSAVLNAAEIAESLQIGKGTAELFLEWDVQE